MTVKELREALEKYPDDCVVMKEVMLTVDRSWLENITRIEEHMKTVTDNKLYITLV